MPVRGAIFLLVYMVLCALQYAGAENVHMLDIKSNLTRALVLPPISLGSVAGSYSKTTANFTNLYGLLVAKNSLVVAGNSTIYRVDFNGNLSLIMSAGKGYADGVGNNAAFAQIDGLAWDTSSAPRTDTPLERDVYVCDGPNHVLRKITPDLVVSTVAGSVNSTQVIDGNGTMASFEYPTDICYSDYHKLYFIADHHIRSFDPVTSVVSTVVQLPGQFSVEYITCSDDGALYYSDSVSVIYKVVNIGTSNVYTFPYVGVSGSVGCGDGSGGASRVAKPRALCAFPAGLFITQEQCTSLRYVDAEGLLTSLTGRYNTYSYVFRPSTAPGDPLATVAGLPGSAVYDVSTQMLFITDDYGVRVAYYEPPPAPMAPYVDSSLVDEKGVFIVSWELPTYKSVITSLSLQYSLGSTGEYLTIFTTSFDLGFERNVSADVFDWSVADSPVVNFRVIATNDYGNTEGPATAVTISDVIVVQSISKPPTQGGFVNITYWNLPTSGVPDVMFGSIPCEGVVIYNSSSLGCKVAAGAGRYPVNIIVNNTDTLLNNAFSYQQATITGVFPAAATVGGDIITLVGKNFGYNSSDVVVTIVSNAYGDLVCANATIVIPHELITCIIPEGSGAKNNVSVTVSQMISKIYPSYTYQAPEIYYFEGDGQFRTDGMSSITVYGKNFGALPRQTLATLYKYNRIQPCPVFFVNHTSFACYVPQGQGVDNIFSLTVDYLPAPTFNISYAAPEVYSATNTLSTQGGRITINGNNFGTDVSLVSISVEGVACTNVAAVTLHSKLACTMPRGTGSKKHISITVDTQTNNDTNTALGYAPPIISYVYTADMFQGGYMTIAGYNFGTDPNVVSVYISRTNGSNSVNCANAYIVPMVPYTQIVCRVPPNSGSRIANVSVDGQNTSYIFSYPAPVLDYIGTIPVAAPLTITGANFGKDESLISVTIGNNGHCIDVKFCYVNYYSKSCITCVTPSGGGSQYINVVVDGLLTQSFASYALPYVSTVSRVKFGSLVTITGTNFGVKTADLQVNFGSYYSSAYCTNISLIASWIVCIAPTMTSSSSYLQVIRSSLYKSNNFYYDSISGANTGGYTTGWEPPPENYTNEAETVIIVIVVIIAVVVFGLIVRYVRRSVNNQAEARQSLLGNNTNYATFVASSAVPASSSSPQQQQPPASPPEPRPVVDVLHKEEEGELVLCDICSEFNKNTAMNCGHMTCHSCSLHLTVCPFCKVPITSRQRVFLS